MPGPRPVRSRFATLVLALALAVFAPPPISAADGEGDADPFAGLSYRSIGPAAGGRVTRVHGVPGDPLSWYVATASGGVWRSRDGGDSWEPIFDDTGMPSAGSIAVAPSDSNVVYVGAGEANSRGNRVEGDGIYRSLDGGDTWEHVWEQSWRAISPGLTRDDEWKQGSAGGPIAGAVLPDPRSDVPAEALEALEAELAQIVEVDLAAYERRACEALPYARPVREDLEVPPGLVVPWFYEYDPPSTLVVEEHPTPRAKYPFVDVHNHQRQMADFTEAEWDELVAAMDAMNMAVMVNLSGRGFRRIERPDGTTGFGFGGTETVRAGIEAAEEHAPGRVVAFTNLDTSQLGTPGWAAAAVAQLEADVAAGARGLKIYKSLGLGSVDAAGERIAVDDPRLDPVWAKCGELGIPVLIHSADPAAFWQERTPENERLLELMERPGRYQGDGESPPFEQILAEQHRLFENHPETIFINAHLGWMGNDLARLGRLLDELPNVYTEIGAVLAELGRQPRTAREFLIRYQDRVLFGKDSWNPGEYPVYFRVLETGDEYFDYYRRRHAFWKMYGLDLPDEVLKKIYYGNALRVVPGLDPSLFPPAP